MQSYKPSDANPFFTSYGNKLDQTNPNVLSASTLVVRVPNASGLWAVVTNPTGPAECMFKPSSEVKC